MRFLVLIKIKIDYHLKGKIDNQLHNSFKILNKEILINNQLIKMFNFQKLNLIKKFKLAIDV